MLSTALQVKMNASTNLFYGLQHVSHTNISRLTKTYFSADNEHHLKDLRRMMADKEG